MLKRKIGFSAAFALIVLLAINPDASAGEWTPPDVDVSLAYEEISAFQDQTITVTSNVAGKGILFVLQPAEGDPWEGLLDDHPGLKALWDELPSSVQNEIREKIGDKIVSYKILQMETAGSTQVSFPSDFNEVNGEPSTALKGKYKVILIFVSFWNICKFVERDFDCDSWFVVPEVPFGTIATLATTIISFVSYSAIKRRKRIL